MSLEKQQQKALIEAEQLLNKTDKQIIGIYKEALKNIRAEILKLNERSEWTQTELLRYNRLNNFQDQVLQELKKVNKEVYKLVKKTNYIIADNTYYRSAYGYETTINMSFNKINSKIIDVLVNNPMPTVSLDEYFKKLSVDTLDQLKKAIGSSLMTGETLSKTTQKIKEVLNVSTEKAMLIARTEGHRISSKSQLIATENAKKLGIESKKIWVATLDNRTRDSHASLDGEKADADGYFTIKTGDNKGAKALAPNTFGIASEDINCRCNYIERIEDTGDYERLDEMGEVIPYITYEEWYNNKLKG